MFKLTDIAKVAIGVLELMDPELEKKTTHEKKKEDSKVMFYYDDVLDVLKDFKHLSLKRRCKVVRELFYNKDFIKWLFQPPTDANIDKLAGDLYVEFCKYETMEAIVEMVKDEGYHEFNRSHATFMTSIANIAIANNNELLNEMEKGKKEGDYSRKEYIRVVDEINEINEMIIKLMKCARKIIKRDATILARECRLPRYITITAMTYCPEAKYIDRYKIGLYLNNLMNTIYSDVNENGNFDERVDWKAFFKELFGKDNVVEAATFILLEGVHRIDKYDNSREVRMCWDSLTSFALKELNNSPAQLRDQMIELYIKRIDKMFGNKAFDLRVNLLNLNEDKFPKLADTVKSHANKLKEIINRGLE